MCCDNLKLNWQAIATADRDALSRSLVEIPQAADYGKNVSSSHGSACVICGKTVSNPIYYLHVVEGGGWAAGPKYQADPASDLGLQPIGRDCLHKHPHLMAFAYKDV